MFPCILPAPIKFRVFRLQGLGLGLGYSGSDGPRGQFAGGNFLDADQTVRASGLGFRTALATPCYRSRSVSRDQAITLAVDCWVPDAGSTSHRQRSKVCTVVQ